MKLSSALLAICLAMVACYGGEDSIIVRGQVLSHRTGMPIDSALIKFVDRNVYTYSDASGNFALYEVGPANLSSEFIVEKPAYKPFRMKLGESGDFVSYHVYSETDFHEFSRPAYTNGPEDSSSFVVGTWVDAYSSAFDYADHTFTFRLDTVDLAGELVRAHRSLKTSRSKVR